MHVICFPYSPLIWFTVMTWYSLSKRAQKFSVFFSLCSSCLFFFFFTWVLHSSEGDRLWPLGVIDATKQERVSCKGANSESGCCICFHTMRFPGFFKFFFFKATYADVGKTYPSRSVVTKWSQLIHLTTTLKSPVKAHTEESGLLVYYRSTTSRWCSQLVGHCCDIWLCGGKCEQTSHFYQLPNLVILWENFTIHSI